MDGPMPHICDSAAWLQVLTVQGPPAPKKSKGGKVCFSSFCPKYEELFVKQVNKHICGKRGDEQRGCTVMIFSSPSLERDANPLERLSISRLPVG